MQLKSLAAKVEPLFRFAILKGSGVASVVDGRMMKMAAKATKRVMMERNMLKDEGRSRFVRARAVLELLELRECNNRGNLVVD